VVRRWRRFAAHREVHPNEVTKWRSQLLGNAAASFGGTALGGDSKERIRELLRDNRRAYGGGQGFFSSALWEIARIEREAMIDRGSRLPVTRQAELLGVSRSSVYYRPRPVSEQDLALMRRLDDLHCTRWRSYTGCASSLQRAGHDVGRRHVTVLLRGWGLWRLLICWRPRKSIRARNATIYRIFVPRERILEAGARCRFHVSANGAS
jgi:putative transposase